MLNNKGLIWSLEVHLCLAPPMSFTRFLSWHAASGVSRSSQTGQCTPYAWSFAIYRLWGNQAKAFHKSIKTTPAGRFLSRAHFRSSTAFSNRLWQLYRFRNALKNHGIYPWNESTWWAIQTILPGIWSYHAVLQGLTLRSNKATQFSSTMLKRTILSLTNSCRIFITLWWELCLSTASLVESSNPMPIVTTRNSH